MSSQLCGNCNGVLQKPWKPTLNKGASSMVKIESSICLPIEVFDGATSGCYICAELWECVPLYYRPKMAGTVQLPAGYRRAFVEFQFSRSDIVPGGFKLYVWADFPGIMNQFPFNYYHIVPKPEITTRKVNARVFSNIARTPTDEYLNTTYDSPARNQIQSWITECRESHQICRAYRQTCSQICKPTRVLDVGELGDTSIKLKILDDSTLEAPYITLSHCWGQTKQPLRLTSETSNEFLSRLSLPRLPRTFHEAVLITRDLGFRYLWIDSLCIYQDSPDDWRTESVKMGDIYAGGYMNLAAYASTNSHGGLVQSRLKTHCFPEILVHEPETESRVFFVQSLNLLHFELGESHLMTRGWVIQETTLTPASLCFTGGQIYWSCSELCADERFPNGIPTFESPTRTQLNVYHQRYLWGQHPFCSEGMIRDISLEAINVWLGFVRRISGTSFTVPEDRFVATSAVSNRLQLILGPKAKMYCGLWSIYLVRQLLWNVQVLSRRKPYEDLRKSTKFYLPSWSWASIDATVGWTFRTDDEHKFYADKLPGQSGSLAWISNIEPKTGIELAEVLSVNLRDEDQFGRVSWAVIRLCGPLLKLSFRHRYQKRYDIFVNDYGLAGTCTVDWDDGIERMREAFGAPLLKSTSGGVSRLRVLLLEPTGSSKGQFLRRGVLDTEGLDTDLEELVTSKPDTMDEYEEWDGRSGFIFTIV
jgi:hypothetical protein